MNVLITGGAGFIGSHTADAFVKKGWGVRVLDSLDPQIHGARDRFPECIDPRVECLKGDVRKYDEIAPALDGIDTVFHLAAHTGVGQSMYSVAQYVDTNCVGTATLLEALSRRRAPIKRLVLASSRAVYGEGAYRCHAHGPVTAQPRSKAQLERGDFAPSCPACGAALEVQPTSESTPCAPVSVYGWTKLHQEQLCQHMATSLGGFELVMLRYFNVVGSRQSLGNPYTGILTVFYKRLLTDGRIPLYELGRPIRDFVHVRDVVAANLAAAEAALPQHCTAINVGSGLAITIREFAETLARVCGRTAVMGTSRQFRIGDIFACVADLTRARTLLGYSPSMDLQAAVHEFVAWAKTQGAEDDADRAAAELERHGILGGRETA